MDEIDFKKVSLFPKKITLAGLFLLIILFASIALVILSQWNALKDMTDSHFPIVERSSINVRIVTLLQEKVSQLIRYEDSSLVDDLKLNFDTLSQNYIELQKLTPLKPLQSYDFYKSFQEIIVLAREKKFSEMQRLLRSSSFNENIENFAFDIYEQTEKLADNRDKRQEEILQNIQVLLAFALVLVLFLSLVFFRIYQGYSSNLKERVYAENKARILGRQRQSLIHVLCHDLGNPVSAIYSLVEIAHLLPDEEREKMPQTIRENARASLDIIELTKRLQSLETGKFSSQIQRVDLRESIEESLRIFEQKINQKKIMVAVQVPQPFEGLSEKVSLIHSVFNNIISNSIKFLPQGGKIKISAESSEDSLILHIQDNGIGMPLHILENIFSDTHATSRKGTSGEEGTGFGMPLVKKFMDAYGGEIKIASTENQGTTTTLIFRKA